MMMAAVDGSHTESARILLIIALVALVLDLTYLPDHAELGTDTPSILCCSIWSKSGNNCHDRHKVIHFADQGLSYLSLT